MGWSFNTLKALNEITSPYIIYTHEDFWIKNSVSTKTIEEYVTYMVEDRADYIRLYPCPGPDHECEFDDRLGVLDDNSDYRTSLQVALWRKSVFQDLIREDENPWQFERYGSLRSKRYGSRFLSVKRFYGPDNKLFHHGVDYVCTAINKGKWSKAARTYAASEELDIDFSNRPGETWWHDFTRSGAFGAFVGQVFALPKIVINKAVKGVGRLFGKK